MIILPVNMLSVVQSWLIHVWPQPKKNGAIINLNYEGVVFYLFYPRHINHLLIILFLQTSKIHHCEHNLLLLLNLRTRPLWDLKSH